MEGWGTFLDIKAAVARMTLEEKAGLLSGLDFWHTKSVERLGINDSIQAVCFPTDC